MARNDLLKNFSNQHTNDFGNFAPKDNGASSSAGNGAKNTPLKGQGSTGGQTPASTTTTNTPGGMPGGGAKSVMHNINNIPGVKNATRDMKADVKASMTGEDPDEMEAEERRKSSDPLRSAAKSEGKKAVNKAMEGSLFSPGNPTATAGLFNKARSSLGSLAHGVKVLGSKMVGGLQGALSMFGGGIAKAGAAAGAFLHTSATVGTVVVVSGTLTAASIPVAGGIGYLTNSFTQKTDGCIPAEYEEELSDDASVEAQGREVAEIARNWCTPSGANHYVWGGWSIGPKDDYDPNNAHSGGADCGHFCQLCFWKAGSTILTPDNPIGFCDEICDVEDGKYIVKRGHITESDCKPGDVLNNSHHAWIYIGNGEIAEASCAKIGLRVAPWRGDATCVTRPYKAKGKEDSGSAGSSTPDAEKQKNMDIAGKAGKELWKQYHIWPSVLVAQALCETQCGSDGTKRAVENNWLCLGAFDSNPDAAPAFPTPKDGLEAGEKNYWGGASSEYKYVILSKSPEEQMKHICKSGWASSHYDDPSGSSGGNLKKVWDSYGLSKYDEGIVDYTPDMSAYGGDLDADSLINASGADENADIAAKTADDGCGGEMDGVDTEDETAFTGQGIVHNNGWTYLNFDMDAVSKLGDQLAGTGDCYIYAIGYADLVMRGKWKFAGDGTASKMEATYGDPSTHYGMPGKIGGKQGLPSSESGVLAKIKEAIMKDHKPVTVCTTAGGGHHFMTVVGWKDSAGQNPSWNDLVVIDSAAPSLPEGTDGSYKIKQFHVMKASYNGGYAGGGASYDGWKK